MGFLRRQSMRRGDGTEKYRHDNYALPALNTLSVVKYSYECEKIRDAKNFCSGANL